MPVNKEINKFKESRTGKVMGWFANRNKKKEPNKPTPSDEMSRPGLDIPARKRKDVHLPFKGSHTQKMQKAEPSEEFKKKHGVR